MTVKQLKSKLQTALKENDAILLAQLKKLSLLDVFELNQSVAEKDIQAIHFIYDYPDYSIIAFPVNKKLGYCGKGYKPKYKPLFDKKMIAEFLKVQPREEREDVKSDIDMLKSELLEACFVRAWKKVVKTNPKTRGFISIHDTIWVRDLSTGEKMLKEKTRFPLI
jgi:hypothetical protein